MPGTLFAVVDVTILCQAAQLTASGANDVRYQRTINEPGGFHRL